MPGLRLPRDVVPLTYDPKLRIDPGSETFSGTIEIKVRVLEPIDLVWLNAKNLTIREARGVILGPQEETVAASTVPGNDNVMGLQFAKVLPAGEVQAVDQLHRHDRERWRAWACSGSRKPASGTR